MGDNSPSPNIDDYVAVSRESFVPGTPVPVDIYIRLSEKKFVLILKEGDKVQFQNMHFHDKTEYLFVRRPDFRKCVGHSLTVAGVVLDSERFSTETKTVYVSKAVDSLFKEISHLGFDYQSLEHSKVITKSIQTLVESKSDLTDVINMMSALSGELIKHSMMVSAISVIIAKRMKWTLSQNIEKLALGALLHDVGMKELPEEVLELPRHAMTREQLVLYESHVYRGVDILRSMPSISDDIIAMALEHHENAPGQGYPRRIRDFKMNPFARIVALADCFSELVMTSINNPQPKTAANALLFIETTLGQPFHKPAFMALKAALSGESEEKKAA